MLAAGIPAAWLDGRGTAVERLRTPYGPLSYSLRQQGTRIMLHIASGTEVPPGGFVFIWPETQPPRSTRVNGKLARWQNGELVIRELPAKVIVQR